jgi:hypothetical protein
LYCSPSSVVGTIAAVVLDLPSRFVIGDAQSSDLGIEVIWQGSATSAPLLPLLGLIIGLVLTTRTGTPHLIGLVLFTLTGFLMIVGVIGEIVEGTSFTGLDQVIYLLFMAAFALLASAPAITSIRALLTGVWKSPVPTRSSGPSV